jgi:hypothetical protein
MQYDQHKSGDFLAVAAGLPLASFPRMSSKYANTLETAANGQILTPGPASCRTSYLAARRERRGFRVSDADKEHGLEIDLALNHSQVRLPTVKNEKPISKAVVKVLATL